MSDNNQKDMNAIKSEMRRNQVLEAAGECFRLNGFHGSSIAQISKLARMSPGHIYYHFNNKEDIVEALVEREENDLAVLLNRLEDSSNKDDLLTTMLNLTTEALEHHTDPTMVAIKLEIMAEAARNPRIAQLLQRIDQSTRERLSSFFSRVMKKEDQKEVKELQGRIELISDIMSGVSLRASYCSTRDKEMLERLIHGVITYLLHDMV